MFNKILIANRGEIACRVAETARQMGIQTVAVYSEADRDSLHTERCDEAWLIGDAPARESYLRAERIIQVARDSGAEAIHPGYGFLSENPEFAEACESAGVVFIGPPSSAIRSMGSKSEAKALMMAAGVPVVAGYHGEEQSQEYLLDQAHAIGFPLLIKASAGGGGKGMRVVADPSSFIPELAACRRESMAAFGDDRVLLERYLERPRHVEFQIFCDQHGNAVHIFERDCSLQRRHQKILEEAPAPGMTEHLREAMGRAATDAARAIGYQGAGTVEFLLDSNGSFHFMEMNTRLQVEHPVTEMISGLDLVEWQLRVAAGEPLPMQQDQLTLSGHAVEARIYAENPANDFLPATGRLHSLRLPGDERHLRIERGVREGDWITPHYDPMIAKLVTWGPDRASALRRLGRALGEFKVLGLNTNIAFLSRLAAHPAFRAAELDTGFIERHPETLESADGEPPSEIIALASLFELQRQQTRAVEQSRASDDPYSPWGSGDGWRMNQKSELRVRFSMDGGLLQVDGSREGAAWHLNIAQQPWICQVIYNHEGALSAELNGRRFKATVVRQGCDLLIHCEERIWQLRLHDGHHSGHETETEDRGLAAPMPGTVVMVNVKPGDQVGKGDALMVIEAMKMEHRISAPGDAKVIAVHFAEGDSVQEGDELLILD